MRAFAAVPSDARLTLGLSVALLMAGALACALAAPPLLWVLMAGTAASALGFLAFCHLEFVTAAWLVVTGATLEMAAIDLIGPEAFQPTIAVVKGAGIALAALAMLRYGPRLDPFNPALAWVLMFFGGWAHGLYLGLSTVDSVRSLIGSVAPFAFGFARVSDGWARTVIQVVPWIPSLAVIAGGALAVIDVHPLFIDSAGWRLAGLGHPAFLGAVAETAIYACLIELYRRGGNATLALLGVNLVILVLTGARAPLLYAMMVAGLSLVFVRSDVFPPRRRFLVFVTAGLVLALGGLVAFIADVDLSAVRLLNLLTNDAVNLSGRLILWPSFEEAAVQSQWLGWGVGAGNLIIPPGGEVADLLQTRAAHNEYLRVAVEGGQVGRGMLVILMMLWVGRHTARLDHVDRIIMRLVFIAFAAHSLTDNTLISTPACVLFTFAVAVFARGQSSESTWLTPPTGRLPDSPRGA